MVDNIKDIGYKEDSMGQGNIFYLIKLQRKDNGSMVREYVGVMNDFNV